MKNFKRVQLLALWGVFCLAQVPSEADEPYFSGIGQVPATELFSTAYAVSGNGTVVVGTSREGAGNYRALRWTVAGGLELLPLGTSTRMEAQDVSFDGSRIAGFMAGGPLGARGFWWTSAGGVVPLAASSLNANGISNDGLVIVGAGGDCTTPCSFGWYQWTDADGFEPMGILPGGNHAEAMAVSGDGTVIVGTGSTSTTTWSAFRWTSSTGSVLLGDLPGGVVASVTNGMSPDGKIVVGHSGSAASNGCCEAFLWNESQGMVGLGFLPGGGPYSQAWSACRGGTVIAGAARENGSIYDSAVVWMRCAGIRRLQELLETDLSLDLTGWELRAAYDVSGDGLTFVGTGVNPEGTAEGWVAHLPCLPGDGNRDGLINGNDIQTFIDAVGTAGTETDDLICAFDFSSNGVVDSFDAQQFASALLCASP